jgi:hypothetical protein
MPCKGKLPLQGNEALSFFFSLTDIWYLGLDPGSCHPSGIPVASRMGVICLAHLISHLSDAPIVLPAWILQKI